MDMTNSGKAVIEGDWIVMRVAIPALPEIVKQSPLLLCRCPKDCSPFVASAAAFAIEVVCELNKEAEDGSTPFHRMFDAAIESTIDAGSEHVVG